MIFSEDDFCDDGGCLISPIAAAARVNERIAGLIEKARDYEAVLRRFPYWEIDPACVPIRDVLKKWEGK